MNKVRSAAGIVALWAALIPAPTGAATPSFTATTISGRNYSSASLRGQNVLIEFWATWCPVCRDDQPAVDNISREFTGRGLVVLAVDPYDSSAEVRKYLEEHPRSCNIVLDEDTDLVAQFKPVTFPYYVLLDRSGEIAGTQDGGGGEEALLDLLRNVGLGGRASGRMRGEDSPSPVLRFSSTKLIDAPRRDLLAHPKPLTPAIFILKSGEKVESRRYTIANGNIEIADLPQPRTIPTTDLDRDATLAADRKRGINLRIPTNSNDVYLGF